MQDSCSSLKNEINHEQYLMHTIKCLNKSLIITRSLVNFKLNTILQAFEYFNFFLTFWCMTKFDTTF